MSLIQSYRLRRPPLQRNPPNDTQSQRSYCNLVLYWISHKYDFAVRIFPANTQYAPPPNPPNDTLPIVHGSPTAGWTVIVITIYEQLKPSCPSFQHLLPSQLLIQPDCKFSLHWVFITSYRILLISLSWWILGMLKMTIIRHRCQLSSTSFNVNIAHWV